MDSQINLNDTYWDRINGFVSELRVDNRWVLRHNADDKPCGELRIVSHPDLKPGYLRAIFTYAISIKNRNKEERLKAFEDFQMELAELEVFPVDREIKTETQTHEAPFKELETMFGVKLKF